jgi:uncharacterized protein YqjF (DUF2071 family)
MLQAAQSVAEAALRPASLVSDSLRQPEVLREVGHRPWPLPRRPWLMGQVWLDLLFAHWRVPREALERVVPAELPLDAHEGQTWIGLTPFRVGGLRLRGTPPVPLLSSFPEINVRTYVTVGGRPGIYFLSLDADSRAAVFAARRSYRLPYFRSEIATQAGERGLAYVSRRVSGDGPSAEFVAEYGPLGGPLPVRDGSLERWLAERYCLYTLDERRRVHRGEIHHPPWPLRDAWATLGTNTMAMPFGLELREEPLLHFSPRQDVALWPLQRLGSEVRP